LKRYSREAILPPHLPKEDFEDQDLADKIGVLRAELYNPLTRTWEMMAAQKRPRLYHSTALLLPDGRVLSMGSNPYANVIEGTVEVYSPPYLYRSDRPLISDSPAQITYGEAFRIEVDDANQISEVVLMRPEVLTHVTNTDQRLLGLEFERLNESRLEIRGPRDRSHMPQGYCMLFVLNNDRVPSKSVFVQVV
ncbi:MAG: galactose oxidase early set domain-containing protein, partial [Anaerolineales bacterium]|nr:galactose oxidase early set domain-containing protein [Anaerolineales bacterium]